MTTIRELRTSQGFSQVQLSVKAGVSIGTINRIEKGRPVVPATFNAVCRALGVTPEKIIGSPVVGMKKSDASDR